jgi:hypothetical protein
VTTGNSGDHDLATMEERQGLTEGSGRDRRRWPMVGGGAQRLASPCLYITEVTLYVATGNNERCAGTEPIALGMTTENSSCPYTKERPQS